MDLRRQASDRGAFTQVTLTKGGNQLGFGTLLRTLRRSAGLSQEALAERAQLSVVTVGALERGTRRAPYPVTVAKLAGALALPPEERARLATAAARPRRRRRPPVDPVTARNQQLAEVGRRVAALQIVGVIVGGRAAESVAESPSTLGALLGLPACVLLVERPVSK